MSFWGTQTNKISFSLEGHFLPPLVTVTNTTKKNLAYQKCFKKRMFLYMNCIKIY